MTLKQKKLAKNLGKARSVKEAMLMSGYSPSVAEARQADVMESLGVKELLDKYLNPNEYFPVIRKSFYATKRDQYTGEIYEDYASQLRGTDQANKLHGFYKEDSFTPTGNINITYVIYSPDHARSQSLDASGPLQDAQLASQSSQDDGGDGQVNL